MAISYAVGEWARAFPLEYIFKAFGSYFVRRRYREPLYHTVLERYVQLITREGVTQGIFLEGGLTRDGKLKPPKIGLLDYVLGIARDPAFASRIYVVPVAVNYDRVLEDRSLLRELASARRAARGRRASRSSARSSRYVCVESGAARPAPVEALRSRGGDGRRADSARAAGSTREPDLFELPEAGAAARGSRRLCDARHVAHRRADSGDAVPLACAAIQSFDRDFIATQARCSSGWPTCATCCVELNGRVIRARPEHRGDVRPRVADAADASRAGRGGRRASR